MESATTIKTVPMVTNDCQVFQVDEPVAMEFGVVKRYLDDNSTDESKPIPLTHVDRFQLKKIIAYCDGRIEFRNREVPPNDEEVKAYDKEFLKKIKVLELKDLILAANYLDVNVFLDVANQAMADRIVNKSPEYVRKLFGIKNDYTPEELEELQKKDAWAYEGVDPDVYDDLQRN